MENRRPQSATHEEACAHVAALFRPTWLRFYVASKLRRDGVFCAAYELLRELTQPILDIGCGVGLLPFYLRARGLRQAVIGLDLDARKIERARFAAQESGYADLEFVEQDAVSGVPDFCGNVILFDALHYLTGSAQQQLLGQLAARVADGGMLLLRDCPREQTARFWATHLGEIFAQTVSWNVGGPLHFPSRASINGAFSGDGFTGEERPMYGRGPFNNRLFIFRRAIAPARESRNDNLARPNVAASTRDNAD